MSTPLPERRLNRAEPSTPVSPAEGAAPPTPLDGGTVPEAGPSQAARATAPIQVPGYDIVGELGRGGMGAVFKGRDPELGRELAVKVLLQDLQENPRSVQRFLEEAQVGGQLQHPGVVPVYAAGRLPDQRPYFTMKLVEGRTLAALLKERPNPAHDLPRFLQVIEQICQTTAYAHSRGVLHRDLKPLNVMVGAFGEVQVMDWGLAKVLEGRGVRTTRPAQAARSEAGSVVGTPAYMAPEQACGDADGLDERSDVFGLGAVLCEILTGAPPYQSKDRGELMRQAARADLADAYHRLDGCGADAELVQLTKACLAAAPADRPRDAGAVAAAMTAHLAGVQERLRKAEVERAAAQAKAAEERKRRRLTVTFAAFVVLALTAGGLALGYWWQGTVQQRLAQEARDHQTDADLTRAEDGLRHEDYVQTKQFLAQAGTRLDAGTSEALRRRHGYVQDQLAFAADLEKMRERGTAFDPTGLRVLPLGRDYDELFARNGLHFGQQSATEIGDAIARSPARTTIIQSMYHWFGNDRSRRADLAAVLDRIDADSVWRVWVRKASLDGPPVADQGEQGPDVKAMTLDDMRALIFVVRSNPDFFGRGSQPGKALHPATARGIGDAALAMKKLQEAHPDDFWFNLFMASGVVAAQPHRPQPGLPYARAALAVRPDSPLANYLIGYMLLESGGTVDDAILFFNRVLDLDPQHLGAAMGIARALDRKKDYAGAIAAYKKALELNPEYALTYSNMAMTLRNQHEMEAAKTAALKAVEMDSNLAIAHNNLGMLLLDSGDHVGAVEHYKQAIKLDPTLAVAYFNLGSALKTQDADAAIAAYRQAIKIDPTYAAAHNDLGTALWKKGMLEESRAELEAAVAAEPTNALYFSNLGDTLRAKGELDAAVRACRRAIELDPLYASGFINLSAVLTDKGDFGGAAAVLNSAIKAIPRNADLYEHLGLDLRLKGDNDGAAAAYRKAIEINPRHENANWALGLLLMSRGDLESALPYYEAVRDVNPRNGSALFGLGSLYLRLGRFADAEKTLVEADKIGSVVPGQKLPMQDLIDRARQMAKLDERLSATLAGKDKPADGHEMVNLGILCYQYKRMYVAAAKFYADGFAASPALGDDARNHYRQSAACAAVLASQRQGKDADKVTDEEASRLRGQALAWLRADLTFWSKALTGEKAEDQQLARRTLEGWQTAADLAGVRDAALLEKLPPTEREEWHKFWEELSKLLPAK